MTPTIEHDLSVPLPLPPRGLFPDRAHVFEREDLEALNFALAAERPLLLRGEPGTGKSQIAEAAAAALQWPLLARTVDARTESRDLLYEVDLVLRLAEAQLGGALPGADPAKLRESLSLRAYTRPGPLWWAFDWTSASALPLASGANGAGTPSRPATWRVGEGCVVLIDEIDKAEADLPNGLLEVLGNGRFAAPSGEEVRAKGTTPLVVITSNDERELPDAFVRRCLVHTLRLPDDEAPFLAAVERRGAAHFPQVERDVRRRAAEELWRDRQDCDGPRPGLAEYLDLLRVLATLPTQKRQLDALDRVRRYTYSKFRPRAGDAAPAEPVAGMGARQQKDAGRA